VRLSAERRCDQPDVPDVVRFLSVAFRQPKFGERAFTYAGSSVWNSLSKDLGAVTDTGLILSENDSRHTFLVWLSVYADDMDDSVMYI